MNTQAAAVDAALLDLMPGADFADSYVVEVADPNLEAFEAARRMVARPPVWIRVLMMVRHVLVAPFGLTVRLGDPNPRIGSFPLISQSPERVVVGLDDRHLNFVIVVSKERTTNDTCRVSATTLVRTHNAFGRIYLAIVKPFHRRIVAAMLRRVAWPSAPN